MKFQTAAIILGLTISSATFTVLSRSYHDELAYNKGYADSTSYYKQMLLDEGFAEYDRKTAEWHLLDPSTIQGNLIPIQKRFLYTSVEEQIQSYEDELKVLKKQKEAISKKKPHAQVTKLDMKKL